MIAGRDAPTHGEAKNSWLTGTAAWNYVAITQSILGIRPGLDGLQVNPVIPATWPGFEATRVYRGVTYSGIQVSGQRWGGTRCVRGWPPNLWRHHSPTFRRNVARGCPGDFEVTFEMWVAQRPRAQRLRGEWMQSGYFDDLHKEYVITDPCTPVKWINYIGRLAFGGFIDHTAGALLCKGDPALNRITKYITQLPGQRFPRRDALPASARA